MQKKKTPLSCKSVFQCNEADLKREYTKKWIAFFNRQERSKKTAFHKAVIPRRPS